LSSCSAPAARTGARALAIPACAPGSRARRHLIADNLGWFKDVTDGGAQRTIEDIMRAQGVEVKKGSVDADGHVTEYTPA
jgi:protein import protein ZIM17